MKYTVRRGQMTVKARSLVHDATVTWSAISGTILFDPDATSATRAEITVDMRAFDGGDRFSSWKLKSELEADKHPTATFNLTRFAKIHEVSAGQFEASASGHLAWRGHDFDLDVRGKASMDRRGLEASATFELDLHRFGISAPKILSFMIDSLVDVKIALQAVVAS